MLSKLAFRNAKRTINDYLIYIATISIVVALMFSMNSVLLSDNIKTLSTFMEALDFAIIFVTIILLIIISWLIYYIIKFMLAKRSKEFGTYSLLGIRSTKITQLFILENFIIDIISFILGVLLGTLIHQIILTLIYSLFDVPYQIQFAISLEAVLRTIFLYAITYLISFIRSYWYLRKIKVVDLIYAKKKNERLFIKSKAGNTIIFGISIVSIIIGMLLFHSVMTPNTIPSAPILFSSIGAIILGLYGSFLGISAFITRFIDNRKKAFKNMNIFLLRSLVSKVNTMSFTFGTISILLTFTFIFSSLATMINKYYENQAESFAPFDAIIASYNQDPDFSPYLNYFTENNIALDNEFTYHLYSAEKEDVASKLDSIVYDDMVNLMDVYIAESDYNQLRFILGEEPITLNSNQFLIQARNDSTGVIEKAFTTNKEIIVNGSSLTYSGVETIQFSQNGMNGNRYLIVIPDKLAEGIPVLQTNLVLDTTQPTTEKMDTDLKNLISDNTVGTGSGPSVWSIVRGGALTQNKTIFVTFSFSLVFMAILFVLVVITILAIQQLSDSAKFKFRYDILNKLGANNRKIKLLVLKQLSIYFLLPLILPMVISTFLVISLNRWFYIYLASGSATFGYMFTGYLVFFFVYFIYYVITYIGFMRNIEAN